MDSSAATPPSIKSTWFVSMTRNLVTRVREGKSGGEETSSKDGEDDEGTESDSGSGYSTPDNSGKRGAAPRPTVMAGGRRRKVKAKGAKRS